MDGVKYFARKYFGRYFGPKPVEQAVPVTAHDLIVAAFRGMFPAAEPAAAAAGVSFVPAGAGILRSGVGSSARIASRGPSLAAGRSAAGPAAAGAACSASAVGRGGSSIVDSSQAEVKIGHGQ